MDVFDQSLPYHLKKKLWNLKKIDFNVVIFGRHCFVNIHQIVFYNSIFTTLKVKLEHQFMFKFWRMLFSEIEPQRSTLDRIEVGKTIKDCKCENQIKLLHRFSLEGSYYCFLFFFRRSGYLYILHEDVDDVQSFHQFHCHWSGKFRMEKVYLGSIDG